jgi:hypothetical protein
VSLSPRKHASASRVLALDRTQLAWVQGGPSGAPTVGSWSYQDGSVSPLQQAFADAKPGFVDVIACNDVVVHWVQAPPAATASFAELRLVAGARCAYLYGGTPGDWRVAGDWHSTRPFVCCALPQDVVLLIEQRLAELKLLPRWRSAWSVLSYGMPRAFPADGWSAVRGPARVVLWHCRAAQVDCMVIWPIDVQEDITNAARRARQQVHVEISRSGHQSDAHLHWLDLVADDPLPVLEVPGVSTLKRDPRFALLPAGAQSEASVALALRSLLGGSRA